MADLILFIYSFFMVLFWRASTEAFENEANTPGWILVFLSALCGSLIMVKVL